MQQYEHGNMRVVRRRLEHTSMDRALIDFVNANLERLAHKIKTMLDSLSETQLLIQEIHKQVDILEEIIATLGQLKYDQMLSKSSFGRIWNTKYPHVALKETSEFSKCTLCSSLKAKLEAKPSLEERARLLNEQEIHMKQQKSCRSLYYTWHTFSKTQPQKNVCIIHDKMDQKKTTIP